MNHENENIYLIYHVLSQFLLNGVVDWFSGETQSIQVWASCVMCISNKVAHCITDLHLYFPSVFLRMIIMQRKSGENTGFLNKRQSNFSKLLCVHFLINEKNFLIL